jgi:hypothetical protein
MHIAIKPRVAAGLASLGLLMVVGLALPGLASADVTCSGHTQKAQDTEDYENAMDYVFACTGRVLGYMIVSNRELDAFDTEIEVHDAAGTIVPADGFACEGEIPGSGVACFGTYAANNIVRGTFSISAAKACAEPRMEAKLVVVPEAIDANTGVGKKNSIGAMAGPFDLHRPRGCQKSSVLGGLLAEVAALRSEIRGATA